uniref:HECT domain-containing protein n=1 Tax=Schistocephalus solidus TaxID=70667 RepID=A0A183SYR5_SCHSO
LLGVLLTCLRVIRLPPEHADLHEKVTGRLVRVLTNLLQLASSDPAAVASAASAASGLVSRLLTCITEQPDLPVVRTGVARLPGLLAFGDEAAMAAIVDFLRPHVLTLLSPSSPDGRQPAADAIMDCCCSLVVSVPNETPSGRRLRSRLVTDLGLLKSCVDFLWNTMPESVLEQSEESALDKTKTILPPSFSSSSTKEPTMVVFLNEVALPPVLKLMRGCVWSCQPGDPTPPPFPSAPQSRTSRQLLAFLHKLETSKSVGQVGLLAEDLLDEWVGTATAKTSSTPSAAVSAEELDKMPSLSIASVIQEIKDLRQQTVQRNRRLAKEVRQRQLRSLNMKVNEKGQVSFPSVPSWLFYKALIKLISAYMTLENSEGLEALFLLVSFSPTQLAMLAPTHVAKMTAEVVEETGLLCAICHEGPRAAPKEPLGIYVFVRRCLLEEGLARPDIGKPAPTLPSSAYSPEGYTTVSSFVLVHFSCHLNAIKGSNVGEWTVAARHNRDARCNCLMPVMGRVPKATPPTTPAAPESASEKIVSVTKSPKSLADLRRTLDSTFATYMAKFSSHITHMVSFTLSTRLVLHDIKLLLLRFAHGRSFHGETGGGARESNLNLLPYMMQVSLLPSLSWCSSSASCWDPVGPLYSIVAALHLLSPRQWRERRVRLLRHLMALAHARATMLPESAETSSLPPPSFIVIKPYLLFFGLVNSLYEYFFKDIILPSVTDAQTSDESESWRSALSEYIRASDEELLNATPKLLSFFESDLSPAESISEFLDIIGICPIFNFFTFFFFSVGLIYTVIAKSLAAKIPAFSCSMVVFFWIF